jgi:SPP1 family phage portal protein
VTVEQIQKAISSDQKRLAKLAEQRQYAGGRNAAILGRVPHEEPDNRIPVPIARKGIRLVSGYMFKPGNITYSIDDKGNDAYVTNILKPIFDENDEELSTQEEAETALTHGEAWELCYMVDGEIKIDQCIPIWSNDLPPKLLSLIRYYAINVGLQDEGREVYVYDAEAITKYSGKSYDVIEIAPDIDGGPNPQPHIFGEVPLSQRKMARDGSNLFDCVIPIIDIHDRVISEDFANEAQRFANSYLLLRDRLSTELDELGLNEVDKLRITRTFEGLGDDVTRAVAFLTKTIPIDFIKTTSDTFERLIYDMMQIINPNDIATTGQISGIALAYKLLQFEYLCASIEAYFSRGLQWRIRLIQNVQAGMSANPIDRPQVTIQFRRNLPFDMESAVDMFVKLSGLLPDEVILKLFPASFIPDVQKLADEMNAEKQISIDNAPPIPTQLPTGAAPNA